MNITVQFYSYFKELAGCEITTVSAPDGTTVSGLHQMLMSRFPKLESMKKSTLIAVGVNYEPPSHVLREGDEVSLFPPVQGG